jgi:hypothetical protein
MCPCEDFDLWLRLGEIGRLGNLPEPLFVWRRTLTGIVASSVRRMEQAIERALRDAWQRRGLDGVPQVPSYALQSRGDLYRQWAWMALKYGHVRVARNYAGKSLLAQPWRGESWRLAYCAMRGR